MSKTCGLQTYLTEDNSRGYTTNSSDTYILDAIEQATYNMQAETNVKRKRLLKEHLMKLRSEKPSVHLRELQLAAEELLD